MKEEVKKAIEEKFDNMSPEEKSSFISDLKDVTQRGVIEEQAREIEELKTRIEGLLGDLSSAKIENDVLRGVIGEILHTILERRERDKP